MKKVLIIIPAYNEASIIEDTVKRIEKLRIDNVIVNYIVVNDGSIDNTENILNKNNINHIRLINNLGIGGAIQTGYKYALYNNYDIAIQFDGDGQHDEKYIECLIKPILTENYDFVIGSRFVGNESDFKSTMTRRMGISFLSILTKIFTSKAIKDVTSGFRAANKDVIKIFARNYPSDYPEPETNILVLRSGFKVIEIPVRMFERKNGKSSINKFKSIYYMIKVSLSIIFLAISTPKGGK